MKPGDSDDISISRILHFMQSVKAAEFVSTRAAQKTKNGLSHCDTNPYVIMR